MALRNFLNSHENDFEPEEQGRNFDAAARWRGSLLGESLSAREYDDASYTANGAYDRGAYDRGSYEYVPHFRMQDNSGAGHGNGAVYERDFDDLQGEVRNVMTAPAYEVTHGAAANYLAADNYVAGSEPGSSVQLNHYVAGSDPRVGTTLKRTEQAYAQSAWQGREGMPAINPAYYQQNNIYYHEHKHYENRQEVSPSARGTYAHYDDEDDGREQENRHSRRQRKSKGASVKLIAGLLIIATALLFFFFKMNADKERAARTYSLFRSNEDNLNGETLAGNETAQVADGAISAVNQEAAAATQVTADGSSANGEQGADRNAGWTGTTGGSAGLIESSGGTGADPAYAQGGTSDLRGVIPLSSAQLARMININKEPDDANVYNNLDILAEVDPRAREIKEREHELSPGEIRLAAKNEAFDFVYKEFTLAADAAERKADVAAAAGASSLGNYSLPSGKHLNLPYYKQWDERWGYKPYGGSVIGTYGCGVTAMASVLSGMLQDSSLTPDKLALLSADFGTDNAGTDIGFMSLAAEEYNIKAYGIPLTAAALRTELDKGNPVIINVQQGDFTSGGHYIIVVGYNESGSFLIYDPVSPKNVAKTWSIEVLQNQKSQAVWAYSK